MHPGNPSATMPNQNYGQNWGMPPAPGQQQQQQQQPPQQAQGFPPQQMYSNIPPQPQQQQQQAPPMMAPKMPTMQQQMPGPALQQPQQQQQQQPQQPSNYQPQTNGYLSGDYGLNSQMSSLSLNGDLKSPQAPAMPQMAPMGQQQPSMGQTAPPMSQQAPPMGQPAPSMPPMGQPAPSMPQMGHQAPPMPSMGQPAPQMPSIGQQMPPMGQQMPPMGQQMPPHGQQMPPMGQQMPPMGQPAPPMTPMAHPPPSMTPMSQQGQQYYGQSQMNQYQAPSKPPSMAGGVPPYGGYQQQPQQGYGAPNAQPMGQRYPPAPGAGQFPGGFQQQQQQTQQKLDPEGMPSVVQVCAEDKTKYETNNNVLFTTTVPAMVPPLVTTIMENENQVIEDGGSARPNFLRPSIYQVPTNEDSLKTSDIPFGMIIKPFDEQEVEGKIYVPVSNSEIVRCNRCKSYMNPYNRFVDGGRRFQCSLCQHLTEVPQGYYAHLDHTGNRLDKYQRPELFLGSYEFRATDEYCRNGVLNNRRPHIIFACELTETSKPILKILSENLAEIIKNFPRDPLNQLSSPPMFGFITYNSKIQIYDIVNNGAAHVICDLSTPFSPLNSFLVDPLIHMDKIEDFLRNLPLLYANEELEMQPILGPVIEAGLMTTQVDVRNWINQSLAPKITTDADQNEKYDNIPAGKMYIFHCTLPQYGSDEDTPGRIKQRWTTSIEEIRKILGSDKEKTILQPDSNKYYVGLGEKCVKDYATGVEFFLFPPVNGSFLDVATLGELARLSGTGAIYKYFNDFSDDFLTDLRYSLASTFAFDCVVKVRTSTGIRPHDYYGNFHLTLPSDIECAAMNANSNIAVDFKYDDKLQENDHVVIQVAVLYTAISGERRVRLHNTSLATCQQVSDIYRNSCCDTVVNLLAKNAIYPLRKGEKTINQTKEAIVHRVINILTSYRKHCAQPGTSLGQLILPESLKLLPVYTTGILKCDAIDGGPEMQPDDKAHAQLRLLGSHPSLSQVLLYPRLIQIEYEDESEENLKFSQVRCSNYKINPNAMAYLLENGNYLLFLITSTGCSKVKFLNGIFGPAVDSPNKVQMELGIPNLLTNESQFVNKLFKKIETERRCGYKVFIIRQGIDKIESVFRSFLYEDQKIVTRQYGESKLEGLSYVDLLCHLHKEIRAQLN